VYSGYFVFARNSYEQGFLNALEWEVCKDLFSRLVTAQLPRPQGFIYLQVSPQTAYQRVKKRARSAEHTISLSYLEQLHIQHERFFIQEQGCLPDGTLVPVLVVPYDADFDIFSDQAGRLAELVAQFMHVHAIDVQQGLCTV
jgi:deoxyadenosine/deoxycytidine kinase